jgi:3-hydroxyisobutyrate dehydrogenase-like beta-hydroxyacid dehydrogenase
MEGDLKQTVGVIGLGSMGLGAARFCRATLRLWLALNIFVKDLGTVLDAAHEIKFPLPLIAAAHQMFLVAAATGHGYEDDAAVIKIFPGVLLPEAKGSCA